MKLKLRKICIGFLPPSRFIRSEYYPYMYFPGDEVSLERYRKFTKRL